MEYWWVIDLVEWDKAWYWGQREKLENQGGKWEEEKCGERFEWKVGRVVAR